MAMQAKDKLKSTVYNGEHYCWDFERYDVNVNKQQHSIMEGLVETVTQVLTLTLRSGT